MGRECHLTIQIIYPFYPKVRTADVPDHLNSLHHSFSTYDIIKVHRLPSSSAESSTHVYSMPLYYASAARFFASSILYAV